MVRKGVKVLFDLFLVWVSEIFPFSRKVLTLISMLKDFLKNSHLFDIFFFFPKLC